MSTSESRNGQFIYRDTFFVEVGEGKRHPRASIPELKDLLLPGKRGAPAKDQVGHWYEAQLIHYGLPRSKDKNTAKVRLTNALSSSALVVPATVQQIESDLKKEYASSQRKAKLVASKDKVVRSESSSTGKKRKADVLEEAAGTKSSTTSTKVSVKVGDVVIEIDQQSLLAAASTKKQKNAIAGSSTKTAPKQKVTRDSKPTEPTAPQDKKSTADKSKAAPEAKVKHKVDGVSCYGPDATGVDQWKCEPCRKQSENSFLNSLIKYKTKQTAKRSKPFSSSTVQPPRIQSQSLREPTPMSICSNDDSQDEPPPPYSEIAHGRSSQSTECLGRVVQVSGVYSIQLSGHLGLTELMLRISQFRDQMWGRFTIGDKMGLIRLDVIEGLASAERKSFGWRTEDSETGRLRFGRGCDGWIQFDGNGSVRGTFYAINNGKDVDFDGRLEEAYDRETSAEREVEVEELSNTWHGFPHRAYGNGR